MNTRSDRFHELMASISEDELDAIDARIADPNNAVHNEQTEWREEATDPFGMDWSWALPFEENENSARSSTNQTTEELSIVTLNRPMQRFSIRSIGRFARVAIAASLLIAFGALMARRQDSRGEIVLAQADVIFTPTRGTDAPIPLVQVKSQSHGFLTVVVLLPGAPSEPIVIPSRFEKDIQLLPGQVVDSGLFPPGKARSASAVLIVVTQTPASEIVEKDLEETKALFSADDVQVCEDFIQKALSSKNFNPIVFRQIKLDLRQ